MYHSGMSLEHTRMYSRKSIIPGCICMHMVCHRSYDDILHSAEVQTIKWLWKLHQRLGSCPLKVSSDHAHSKPILCKNYSLQANCILDGTICDILPIVGDRHCDNTYQEVIQCCTTICIQLCYARHGIHLFSTYTHCVHTHPVLYTL